jgi:predicted amino acid dehydrogenase
LRLAGTLGAQCVSLTGLIPSGSGFGQDLEKVLPPGSPLVTTGHATTVAAVVFALARTIEHAGLQLADETLAVVGLGSIGSAALQLALSVLPRPRRLVLCDLFSKESSVRALAESLAAKYQIETEVCLAKEGRVPEPVYRARAIIGATNVPGVLDVERLLPGSVIVDDSAPHCFDLEALRRRLASQGDVFANEAGLLQTPAPLSHDLFLPGSAAQAARLLSPTFIQQAFGERHIMGCILSSILSARLGLARTIGFVKPDDALHHYRLLEQLGYEAPTELRCYDFAVDGS